MVKVEKSVLARALNVLGRVVCRTSPVVAHQLVRIVGRERVVSLSACNSDEMMTVRVDGEASEPFEAFVGFMELKRSLGGSRSGVVSFEFRESVLVFSETVRGKERSVTLFSDPNTVWPDTEEPSGDASRVELPEGFSSLLASAAQVVGREDSRPALRGINLNHRGIVATDGKQLLLIPVDWSLPVNVTIPFPLPILTALPEEKGVFRFWKSPDSDRQLFQMEIGCCLWRGNLIREAYPHWEHVIPEASALDYSISFTPEQAVRLIEFLKQVPDRPPYHPVELNVVPEGVEIVAAFDPEHHLTLEAEHSGVKPRAVSVLNRNILLRMLQQGYTRLSANSDGSCPVAAGGGAGTYLAMPIRLSPKKQIAPEPIREEVKMEEKNVEITEPVDVIGELAHSIDELRGKLRILLDESAQLGRKVREAALQQKQKEREFIQARRAIERIRTVSGF